MAVDKISPNDSRVKKDFKEVNGRKWCMFSLLLDGLVRYGYGSADVTN
jgi:hypothetical protein